MTILYSMASVRRSAMAIAICSAFIAVPAAAGPGDPLTPEFTVSNPAVGAFGGTVARNGSGQTIVVYGSSGLKAQRLDTAGEPIGPAILVSPQGDRQQAAMDAAGNFVVTWQEGDAVKAQLYFATGTPRGGSIVVEDEAGDSLGSDVAMDSDGDFVVAWNRIVRSDFLVAPPIGFPYGIVTLQFGKSRTQARRYHSDGTPNGEVVAVGSDSLPLTPPTYQPVEPSVAMDADGDSMVVWHTQRRKVYARRIPASGPLRAAKVLVSTGMYPTVAMDALGNASVVWSQPHPTGANSSSGYDFYTRRFAAASTRPGTKIRVSQDVGVDAQASIAMNAVGEAAVAWAGSASDFCCVPRQISMQRLAPDGSLLGVNRAFAQTHGADNAQTGIDDAANFIVTFDLRAFPAQPVIRARLHSGF